MHVALWEISIPYEYNIKVYMTSMVAGLCKVGNPITDEYISKLVNISYAYTLFQRTVNMSIGLESAQSPVKGE